MRAEQRCGPGGKLIMKPGTTECFPGGTPILGATGDTAGAPEMLTEVEAAIRTLPASAQRETLLR
jgi:hypothetical protein